ncbi:MAG: Gfo/Idh/MocA family oxidoreductase [Alphaproteobacteria bacterium]|nr:Gfo/Idh/MocA family oxidoreductase [Alphaproteobacteria bacterium]
MANPLRIGIIGTSFVSDWICEAAQMSERCAMSAVFSRDHSRGEAFAGKHGIDSCFDDEEAFLSSDQIDAVYVASPNIAHYRQAMAALAHGKHVLCEKPLAINAAQAERMIAFAHEKGLILLEAIRPVFDPFLTALRDNLHKVGRVRRATFEFCQYSSRYDRFLAGERPNVFEASLGNAALMDLAVYCLQACVAVFGVPQQLTASASFLPNGTEAAGTMLLEYPDQQTTISYSKVTSSVHPSIVQGELGTLVFDTLNQPSYLRMIYRDGRTEELFTPVKNNMVHELNAFARMVASGESTTSYDEQSLRVLRLLDEARRQTGIDFGAGEAL